MSAWEELPTSWIGSSDDYEKYKSDSPGFSYYAIKTAVEEIVEAEEESGELLVEEIEEAPAEVPAEEAPEEEEAPQAAVEEEKPTEAAHDYAVLIAVFILAIISGAAYHLTHKK